MTARLAKWLLLASVFPAALHAQLALTTVAADGSESAVAMFVPFGQAATGAIDGIHFRLRNPGTAAASITALSITTPGSLGLAFTITNGPTLPYSLAVAGMVDFSVQFSGTVVGGYSATLLVTSGGTSQSWILLGSVVGAPPLTVASPCTGPDASGNITFGASSCVFTLLNPAAQAFPVSPITVTGSGFSGLPSSYATGVTIPASGSVSFTLAYSGPSSGTGTLVIATQTYTLNASTAATTGATSTLTFGVIASDGSGTETTLGTPAAYDFGQVAAGDAKTVHFKVHNTGSTAVTITTLDTNTAPSACAPATVAGFAVVTSTCPPFVIAPSAAADIYVQFSAPTPNVYTGTLYVNSQTVSLQATAVAAATLTVASPCTGPDSTATVNFGRTQVGTSISCQFTLTNSNASTLILPPLTVTGTEFTGLPTNGITIATGQSIPLTLTFTAKTYTGECGPLNQYNACETLVVGARSYVLAGVGFAAALVTPSITFDNSTMNSGEQHTLTISLPSAATVTTSGTLTLAFKPQPAGITDDSAIQFISTNTRVATFSVTAGSTAVTINGKANIDFQTGTTAGQLTFSLNDGIYGFASDPTTTVTLGPLPISITSTPTAVTELGALKVSITGFDNTYSMGPMTFTFYDLSGKVIGTPVQADFTKNFQTLFQGGAGSSFLMGLSFPVNGDQTQVGSVAATLTNSAGTVKISNLIFQP